MTRTQDQINQLAADFLALWDDNEEDMGEQAAFAVACEDGNVCEGQYIDNSKCQHPFAGFVTRPMWPQRAGVRITHWQPLPAPPSLQANGVSGSPSSPIQTSELEDASNGMGLR